MKKICLAVLLLSTISLAGEWETFDLRENGTIPVWTVAGPFPNGKPDFHGEGCFGYYRDFLLIPDAGKNCEHEHCTIT